MPKVRRNFLSLPDVIEANVIPEGSGIPNGIISQLRSNVQSITSYVEPSYYTSTGTHNGNAEALVKWENIIQAQGKTAYLQVEFKQGFVYPTFYSLKGYNAGYIFAKEWVLYGFNSLDEEKVILSKNKSQGSTFCSTSSYCDNANWATFSVDPVQKSFKYFRMMSLATSSTQNNWWIFSGGFEVFGIYSIDGITPSTIRKRKRMMRTCVPINRLSFYSSLLFTLYICY